MKARFLSSYLLPSGDASSGKNLFLGFQVRKKVPREVFLNFFHVNSRLI